MIEKNLTYYLTHPHEAGNIPEADLKSWEAAYPYSFGVRWLRARKSLDGLSPEASGYIARAAAFANDLPFLHYRLMEQPAEDLDMSLFEELPTTEDLTEKEKVQSTVPPKKVEVKKTPLKSQDGKRLRKVIKSAKNDQVKLSEDADLPKDIQEAPKAPPENPKEDDKGTSKAKPKVTSQLKSKKKEEAKEVTPPIQPRKPAQKQKTSTQKTKERMVREGLQKEKKEFTSFTQWLLTLEGSKVPTKDKPSKKKKLSKKSKLSSRAKAKKNRLEKLITNSVAEKDEAISETYAQLLDRQGYSEKAEEVYRKLMLKFPEKSDYFASKIRNLDKT